MAVPDVSVDELDRYLADSLVPTEDPLEWWKMNWKVYPNLAKLAISVHLAMGTWSLSLLSSISPLTYFVASSVSVERTFSRGRILISHLCNQLRPGTIQALMCFGDWSRLDLFKPAELVAMLEEEDHPEEQVEPFVDDEGNMFV